MMMSVQEGGGAETPQIQIVTDFIIDSSPWGALMPYVGFGTAALGQDCGVVVHQAIDKGFRHFDTAMGMYVMSCAYIMYVQTIFPTYSLTHTQPKHGMMKVLLVLPSKNPLVVFHVKSSLLSQRFIQGIMDIRKH